MMSKRNSVVAQLALFLCLAICIAGCGGGGGGSTHVTSTQSRGDGTITTPLEEPTPSPAPNQPLEELRGQPEYVGTWTGRTSQGRNIVFVVSENEVVSFSLDGADVPLQGPEGIAKNGFTLAVIGDIRTYAITGDIDSETAASGLIAVSGDLTIADTWTATKQ